MKLKVCGLREADNIAEVADLQPDMMGFIFYEKSSRYVGHQLSISSLEQLPQSIKKVGVFVNEDIKELKQIAQEYALDYLQLHGHETSVYCRELTADGFNVIKAFHVGEGFDFTQVAAYEDCCEFFLFDTKGKDYGGNGIKFNWEQLATYQSEVPFLLSGGIGLEDAEAVSNFTHPQMIGIDVNSAFEDRPAFKNVTKLQAFIKQLACHSYID